MRHRGIVSRTQMTIAEPGITTAEQLLRIAVETGRIDAGPVRTRRI